MAVTLDAAERGGVDNMSALAMHKHTRQELLNTVEWAVDVDFIDIAPFFVRRIQNLVTTANAGVVEQDVQVAEVLCHCVSGSLQ